MLLNPFTLQNSTTKKPYRKPHLKKRGTVKQVTKLGKLGSEEDFDSQNNFEP